MSTTRESIRRSAAALVRDVENSVRHRPGERSALRRSLGVAPAELARTRPVACRVVVPHIGAFDGKDLSPRQRDSLERSFYAVAALVAHQPRFADEQEIEDQETEGQDSEARGNEDEANDAQADAQASAAGEGHDNATAVPEETPPTGATPTEQGKDPEKPEELNLGAALAASALRQSRDPQDEPGEPRDPGGEQRWVAPQEKRLHLLCRQDLDGLYRHLPRVMRLLRSQAVTPDWTELAEDLYRWGGSGSRDLVAKRWLDSYYRKLSSPPA